MNLSEIVERTKSAGNNVFRIKGKGEKVRDVPINDDWMPVVLKLEAAVDLTGFYLPGRFGGALHTSTVWRKISTRTGYNPHSLRHRAGTAVFEGTGNNLRVAQEFLGHASPEMTARYVHVTRDDLRRASVAARLAA